MTKKYGSRPLPQPSPCPRKGHHGQILGPLHDRFCLQCGYDDTDPKNMSFGNYSAPREPMTPLARQKAQRVAAGPVHHYDAEGNLLAVTRSGRLPKKFRNQVKVSRITPPKDGTYSATPNQIRRRARRLMAKGMGREEAMRVAREQADS